MTTRKTDDEQEERQLSPDQQYARDTLQRLAPKGSTIYPVLRHIFHKEDIPTWAVSLYILTPDAFGVPYPIKIDGHASMLLDLKLIQSPITYNTGLAYRGVGSDVGLELVMMLGQAVWDNRGAWGLQWL